MFEIIQILVDAVLIAAIVLLAVAHGSDRLVSDELDVFKDVVDNELSKIHGKIDHAKPKGKRR